MTPSWSGYLLRSAARQVGRRRARRRSSAAITDPFTIVLWLLELGPAPPSARPAATLTVSHI